MSDADPKYRFRFFRPSEAYLDAWVEHPAFGKVNYRLGSENGMGMLAYLMQSSGQPDGDIVATEVRRRIPLVHYFESLHRLAENREPYPLPPVPVLQALAQLNETPEAWATIKCKPDLLARDYVMIEDGVATLTEAGNAAMLGKAPSRKVAADSNTISAIAYTGLRQVQMGHWATIDGRAKLYLAKYNLVDGETITEAGEAAMTIYEAEHGRPDVAPPIEKVAPVPKPPREPKQKRVVLTEKQIEAFRTVIKQPHRWDILPTKTRNFLITNNWVMVDGDNTKITPEGQRVYNASLADAEA